VLSGLTGLVDAREVDQAEGVGVLKALKLDMQIDLNLVLVNQ